MSHSSALIEADIHAYLQQHENKDLLRLLTCGSVDDGKSTLIGRLLFDSQLVYEDHLAALHRDSERLGNAGEALDLALLVDGLASEREQGITIDVAYRYFSTDKRKFIIADTPGHEQYTRNMATGASTAQLAIVMVDARKGVLAQTRRHSFICSLLGIRNIVVAINKMDLVDYSESVFEAIKADYQRVANELNLANVFFVPVSALTGDNVVHASEKTPWYSGQSLLEILENVEVQGANNTADLRFPVQYVNRPNLDFRGYCGTLASGVLRPGDAVTVVPSGVSTKVKAIHVYEGEIPAAYAGDAITVTLEDEVDISRGDTLVHSQSLPPTGQHFNAHLVWLHETPMAPGREYLIKLGTRTTQAVVRKVHEELNINELTRQAVEPGHGLGLNAIGRCEIEAVEPLILEAYQEHPRTGAFVLIDRLTNLTVAAGMVEERISVEATHVRWHEHTVSAGERAALKQQKPCLLWFTGLSGSGKSTLANALDVALTERGYHTYLLDGDNVRHGLCSDLGFSTEHREENIRRVGEVSRLFTDAGLIVLSAFISPFASDRERVRCLFPEGEFVEVFVDTPLAECEARDPKGLYKKARAGEIRQFTGIDSPYEAPKKPEIHLNTAKQSVADCVAAVMEFLQRR